MFTGQAAELAAALKQQAVPLTTLFWTGTGDHLNNFDLPQAQTAFQRTLAFHREDQELSA